MIDNTTAVAVINNMGTCHSRDYHSVGLQIWQFCTANNIWLTAAHIPGSKNVLADKESRHFHSQDTEWKLNSLDLQHALVALNFQPEIDLFASRLNKQFARYCSYRPDPGAMFVDAFSISWAELKIYCFPPFSCLLQAVKKIIQEQAMGILVVPDWPTQPWYPLLATLHVQPPVVLQPSQKLLSLCHSPETSHSLCRKLKLLVCHVSGNNYNNVATR